MNTQKVILIIIILIIAIFGFYFMFQNSQKKEEPKENNSGNQGAVGEEDKSSSSPFTVARVLKEQNGGLEVEVIQEGQGKEAENGNIISVHYTGTLEDGSKFDSSRDRGQPFSFTLGAGQVIRGWDLGVLGMKVGEKRKLTIPPELGYGERGTPGGPIPPNAILIFEVELLNVQ